MPASSLRRKSSGKASSAKRAEKTPRRPFTRVELIEAEQTAQDIFVGRRPSYALDEMRAIIAKRSKHG